MTTPEHRMTICKMAVHHADINPSFGEGVIYVEVDDEAAGPFVMLSQPSITAPEHAGKVCIDYTSEWPAVVQAVRMIMAQPGIKDQTP